MALIEQRPLTTWLGKPSFNVLQLDHNQFKLHHQPQHSSLQPTLSPVQQQCTQDD